MPVLKIKYGDDLRRISLERNPSYAELFQITKQLFNLNIDFILKYEDEDKDMITLASDSDALDAVKIAEQHFSNILRLFVVEKTNKMSDSVNLSGSLCGSMSMSTSRTDATGVELQTHQNVVCDVCQASPIVGNRFKCTVCPDYDLCDGCMLKGNHYQHPMTKIVTPLSSSCSFQPFLKLTKAKKLSAKFIKDVTVVDGSVVIPASKFAKMWRVRNEGTQWPEGTVLVHVGGDILGASASIPVPTAKAGEEVDLTVDMTAPILPGRYNSFWRLSGPDGQRFGQRMWVDITVRNARKEVEPQEFAKLSITEPSAPVESLPVVLPSVVEPVAVAKPEPIAVEPVAVVEPEPVAAPEPVVPAVPVQPEPIAPVEPVVPVAEPVVAKPAEPRDNKVTLQEMQDLRTLVEMGFSGDLLSILRRNNGNIDMAIQQLLG